MANELRVSIAADTSALGSGLDDAQAQVAAAAKGMASSQDIAAQAARNLADAQRQLGTAAAQGSASAQAIIASYTQEAAAAQQAAAATDQLTAATTRASTAVPALRWSMRDAAQGMGTMGVSARQGAAAGIGVLEGRMMSGNRAAAAFLSTTLGLGPAIQAAFPILGALALGEVLIDIGRNAYDAYEKFISIDSVWNKLEEDVRKMQGQDFVNVHSIETATLRLNQANDAAANLRDTAEGLHKAGFADIVPALLSGNIGQIASAAALLAGGHSDAAGSAEKTKQSIVLQAKQIEDEHSLTDLKIEAAHAADGALGPEQKITAEYSKRLALAKEEQHYNQLRDRLMGNAVAKDSGSEEAGLQQRIAAGEREVQENELLKQSIARMVSEGIADKRREMEEDERITAEITAGAERQFRAEDVIRKQEEEAQKRATEELHRQRAEREEEARSVAQTEIQAANETFATDQREIQMKEQLGLVSHKVATEMLLDAERQKEAATQGALRKEASVYDPVEGGRELEQFTQVENRMTQEAQKAAAEREKITQQETQKFMQQWKAAANEFNRDFTTAFNSLLTKQDSAEKAFGKMFGSIELQLVDFVAQWLLKQGEMWLMNEILQASGLSTQRAKQSTANAATVISDAGVAAAGTMAYYSSIDPPIAPAMASLAYAQTVAFGSVAAFEHGGMVMGSRGAPIPILAHAGERVLSAGQTSNFESMVNQGGARSATLNQTNHFGGGVTEEMLEAHSNQTVNKMRGMLRPEAFR